MCEEQLELIPPQKEKELEERFEDGYSIESVSHALGLNRQVTLKFYMDRQKLIEERAKKKELMYASIRRYADPVIKAFDKWNTLKVNLDRLRLLAESEDFREKKVAFSHLSEYIQLTDEAWKEYQAIKAETEQVVESSGKRGLKYFYSLLEVASKWNH